MHFEIERASLRSAEHWHPPLSLIRFHANDNGQMTSDK